MTRGAKTTAKIENLVINSPFERPWAWYQYDEANQVFVKQDGRRPAGYQVSTPKAKKLIRDPGTFVRLELVNRIRERVDAWRVDDYPGITGVTRRLLEHWQDSTEREGLRFFFCQLEAIETLIWLNESSPADRQGLGIPSDGGPFERLCTKLATGTGKTVVMAMLIAYHGCNHAAYPRDKRFRSDVLVVAPNLTVRERLGVLVPGSEGNYYRLFRMLPPGYADRLSQTRVRIMNWHQFSWDTQDQLDEKAAKGRLRSVDKRTRMAKSDRAWLKETLEDFADARDLLVINDEAHHAWRLTEEQKKDRGVKKSEQADATVWVEGLDRTARTCGVLRCHDFSATPMLPGEKGEDALFDWVISDFGLNDAIESGLVKTPRLVIRDNLVPKKVKGEKNYRSRIRHLYLDDDVQSDLNRKAEEDEALPQIVRNAYTLLGADWKQAHERWQTAGHPTPPVMISVVNRTETAARVHREFVAKKIDVPGLNDANTTLRIDSKVLAKAENAEEPLAEVEVDDEEAIKLTKDQEAELTRQMVATTGQIGQPGEQLRHVISVAMLSEGWDCKTVTHIMGLRAFSSQLLCEQVVGRGLRRTSYELNEHGLFDPQYVNVFGVPFRFLPCQESDDGDVAAPPVPTDRVYAVPERRLDYEITWPNVLRVESAVSRTLELDVETLKPLTLSEAETLVAADVAAHIDGKANLDAYDELQVRSLFEQNRMQSFVFRAAAEIAQPLESQFAGGRGELVGQLIRLVERAVASDKVVLKPKSRASDPIWRQVMLGLNSGRVVHWIREAVRQENTDRLVAIFDEDQPLMSTSNLVEWYTAKPNELTTKSHINRCVYDSTWEGSEAYYLEKDKRVAAWAKNDHLGFGVRYRTVNGALRVFRPDFLVRLTSGLTIVVEVKGQDDADQQAKRAALADWVAAVNANGHFGRWASGVCLAPTEIVDLISDLAQ